MTPLRPVSAVEARRLLAAARPITAVEEVAVEDAAGRVLATPVVAGEDLPAFPRAAMDGYAVRAADLPGRLEVVGSVIIGEGPTLSVGPGQALAIPTGGHLPDGADAVVMVEHTRRDGGAVVVEAALEPGRHVMRVGEDVAAGSALIAAGQRLAPPHIAALAALGVTRVAVHRRPRVAVLSTGGELCSVAGRPPPGRVRDANQYALAAGASGCDVTRAGQVGDDPVALTSALRALAAAHELVLVSGGTSVGGRDHTAAVLAGLGALLFHGLEVRPGRPTAAAAVGSSLIVALPGVPAAALIIFTVFVRPLLAELAGGTRPPAGRARLAARHQSEPGREDYLRVRLEDGVAHLVAGGTSSLAALVAADGLAVIPADISVVEAGGEVDVLGWS
jgi:molybdopterin molybdotransferase